MIAGNKRKEAIARWCWFTKPVRFDACAENEFVICKSAKKKWWRLRRFDKCTVDTLVARAKTEKNIEAKFGDVPGAARVSVVPLTRHSFDVRAMMDIKGDETIYRRNKDTRAVEEIKFGDVRGGDNVIRRVEVAPEWGQARIDDCEYNDFVAVLDWRRVCKAVTYAMLVLISISVLIGGMCWYCNSKKENPTPQKEQPQEPPKPPKGKMKKPEPPKPPIAPQPERVVLGYENGVEILALSVRTNNAGAVIEKLKLADGTSKTKVHPKPPLFENPCDQVIAMAISTKPGDSMPPLPDLAGIDQDFANSLLSPIEINEDDSDEVKNIKAMVIEVRKTLAEEVKNGGSVMDVLMEHQAEMNRLYERRLDAILMMQRICADEGLEAAQEFADAVNDKFEEDGIPSIPVVGRGRNQHRRESQ